MSSIDTLLPEFLNATYMQMRNGLLAKNHPENEAYQKAFEDGKNKRTEYLNNMSNLFSEQLGEHFNKEALREFNVVAQRELGVLAYDVLSSEKQNASHAPQAIQIADSLKNATIMIGQQIERLPIVIEVGQPSKQLFDAIDIGSSIDHLPSSAKDPQNELLEMIQQAAHSDIERVLDKATPVQTNTVYMTNYINRDTQFEKFKEAYQLLNEKYALHPNAEPKWYNNIKQFVDTDNAKLGQFEDETTSRYNENQDENKEKWRERLNELESEAAQQPIFINNFEMFKDYQYYNTSFKELTKMNADQTLNVEHIVFHQPLARTQQLNADQTPEKIKNQYRRFHLPNTKEGPFTVEIADSIAIVAPHIRVYDEEINATIDEPHNNPYERRTLRQATEAALIDASVAEFETQHVNMETLIRYIDQGKSVTRAPNNKHTLYHDYARQQLNGSFDNYVGHQTVSAMYHAIRNKDDLTPEALTEAYIMQSYSPTHETEYEEGYSNPFYQAVAELEQFKAFSSEPEPWLDDYLQLIEDTKDIKQYLYFNNNESYARDTIDRLENDEELQRLGIQVQDYFEELNSEDDEYTDDYDESFDDDFQDFDEWYDENYQDYNEPFDEQDVRAQKLAQLAQELNEYQESQQATNGTNSIQAFDIDYN